MVVVRLTHRPRAQVETTPPAKPSLSRGRTITRVKPARINTIPLPPLPPQPSKFSEALKLGDWRNHEAARCPAFLRTGKRALLQATSADVNSSPLGQSRTNRSRRIYAKVRTMRAGDLTGACNYALCLVSRPDLPPAPHPS
jgi:hypothetical protein